MKVKFGPDWSEFVTLLLVHRVRFVLVGGHAFAGHAEPRLTEDLDVFVVAKDVAERIGAHDSGKGARYTRGRGPLTVCATRRCHSKGTALRLELRAKGLTREEKDAIAEPPMFRAFARQSLRRAGAPRG